MFQKLYKKRIPKKKKTKIKTGIPNVIKFLFETFFRITNN